MRENVAHLLMASFVDQWGVDLLLEGGLEQLTERQLESQLRLRLGRTLVRQAVLNGVGFRHTAPCWECWRKVNIPPLVHTAPLLLQWWHYTDSGAFRQQCYLFMAWVVVDSADLLDGTPMTSQVNDIVTLDAGPLIQLLTRSDLDLLLGDPDKVATWWRQQLRRPLEERPAGLTAELDTPRGRAELLLRPELLLQAVRVNVPDGRLTVDATAGLWRRRLQQLLSGDRLRTMYNAITGWWPDRWEMTSHYLAVHEADSDDSEHDEDGETGGEKRRSADEDQTSGGLPSPQREKWQQLERQHQQLWQQLERRGHGERRSLSQQHDEERRRLERIHDRKWRSMEMRHHDERKRLHQRHESEKEKELEKKLEKELEQELEKEKEKVQKKNLKVEEVEDKPVEREVTRRHRQQLIQLQERHNQELEEQRRRHRQEREDLERRLSRRRHGPERRHGQ
ncbi:Reticulocyte-binding protein 2 a [Amphibalanus amphitrite]|uniref:Reticulocyte-binding protein 2 a n=1 Tax=Amphibalanus amphitrite TaxID=1232801 RepID=A0A6A4VMR7_AMPAM|nr:Reticulocyte-binding protein 2 a [Amphibalanus amphitrite]